MARCAETSDSAETGGDHPVAARDCAVTGGGAGGEVATVVLRPGTGALVVALAGAAPIRGAEVPTADLVPGGTAGASARLRPQWVHLITESRISPEQCGQVFML
jgi:hypothetical protein